MKKNPNKVIIPCRFSYLHCWEPDSINGSEPKYSVSAIIPKSDTATINAIKVAIENAKKESMITFQLSRRNKILLGFLRTRFQTQLIFLQL